MLKVTSKFVAVSDFNHVTNSEKRLHKRTLVVTVQQSQRTVPRFWATPAQQRWASSLPMNTVVLFVPQQEAWVVERMGRFHRILEPVPVRVLSRKRRCCGILTDRFWSLLGFELPHTHPGPDSLRAESERDCDRRPGAVGRFSGFVSTNCEERQVTIRHNKPETERLRLVFISLWRKI